MIGASPQVVTGDSPMDTNTDSRAGPSDDLAASPSASASNSVWLSCCGQQRQVRNIAESLILSGMFVRAVWRAASRKLWSRSESGDDIIESSLGKGASSTLCHATQFRATGNRDYLRRHAVGRVGQR